MMQTRSVHVTEALENSSEYDHGVFGAPAYRSQNRSEATGSIEE